MTTTTWPVRRRRAAACGILTALLWTSGCAGLIEPPDRQTWPQTALQCLTFDPIYLAETSIQGLTLADRRQIATHNAVWQALCENPEPQP